MIKINIVGTIFGLTGYDIHTRNLANALYKVADCRLTTQPPQDWMKHVNDAELDMITKPERKDDYNLIISMPHTWKLFTGLGKNIGYCVWEGDKVPESWIEEFMNPKIDYIFVPSEHTKRAILNTIPTKGTIDEQLPEWMNKIKVIPHGVDRNIFHSQDADSKALTHSNTFKFICNKGWRGTSWDRGGVQYVIKAFAEEFSKDEKVQLMLKLNPSYINPAHIQQAMQQLNLGDDHPQIYLTCENIPFDKLPTLYNQSDCYVCATRAEAFDLGSAEAMACGLPCLISGYGGQIEHMIENKNALFFDYDMSKVKEDLMYEEISWCMPKIDDIRKKMRWVFENQEKVKQMGIKAEQYIGDNFTWDLSAKKIISVLE